MQQNKSPKKVAKIDQIFSYIIILIPILEFYKSPLSSMNIATFLMIPLCIMLFLIKLKEFKSPPLVLLLYLLVVVLNLLATDTFSTQITTFIRTLVWFFAIFVFGFSCFEEELYFKTLRRVLITASILIIIQGFFIYVLGHSFKIWIPSLLRAESYLESSEDLYRPSAFYLEPAHFAQSAMLLLTYLMFGGTKKYDYRMHINTIILISLAVIVSGSGQGILYLVILFLLWILYSFKGKSSKINLFVIVLCVSLFVLILLYTSLGQYSLSRIMPSDDYGFGGKALAGRIYGMTLLDDMKASQIMWGVGIYSVSQYTDAYMTSYISSFFSMGVIGLSYFVLLIIYTFIKSAPYAKRFILLYSVMFFIASVTNISNIAFFFYPLLNSIKKYDGRFVN